MNVLRDPDAILAAWLEEGPNRLPEPTKRAIVVTTRTTHQTRRPMWSPWRFPTMNGSSRLALAAVAIVAVALGGLFLFNRSPDSGVGGAPSSSPSAAPSPSASSSQSVAPRPSATAPPALSGSYTSAIHGISTSYPAGWRIIEAATQPWTSGGPTTCQPACEDRINEKEEDSAFLSLASQPLEGLTGEQWAAQVQSDPGLGGTCPPTVEPISIDGAPGMIAFICGEGLLTAQTWVDGRGYFIVLYRVDDKDWFKQILATVRLHPEDAVIPAASPSAGPSPSSKPSPS